MSLDISLRKMQMVDVHSQNITHNLTGMAAAAGIYEALWRPDEVGIRLARDLIEPLESGLAKLKADPAHFKTMNPENGWGSYEAFIPWIETLLAACREHPDAEVKAWR